MPNNEDEPLELGAFWTEAARQQAQPPRDVDQFYREARNAFRTATVEALRLSRSLGGQFVTPPRRGWATVLFTRICVTAVSIRRLVPDLGKRRNYDHWDFGAIATLVRVLMETHLLMFYFGIEDVSEDEWLMRKWLIDLHDAVSRRKLLGPSGPGEPDEGAEILAWLQTRLAGHPLFKAMPERRQTHFLRGKDACFLIQDEIIDRMGADVEAFRYMYHFLSAQTHSLPLAFHRMLESNHGRGFENERDKAYIALALNFAAKIMELASEQLRGIFPDSPPAAGA